MNIEEIENRVREIDAKIVELKNEKLLIKLQVRIFKSNQASKLRQEGKTLQQIADIKGISRQAVHQLLTK